MYKNRILAFILLICMLCTMICEYNVQNVQAQNAEDFVYEIIEEEVKITGYKGDITGDLIIPDYIEGYPVTVIGDNVFNFGAEKDAFLGGRLQLPVNLKRIEDRAFEQCRFFGELKLPDGLEYIGENAFSNCQFFSGDLIIPDSVTDVMVGAFQNSGFNGKLKLSNNMKIIHEYSFFGCTELREIVCLPKGLKGVKQRAFEGDTKIKGPIVLPDSVFYLESNAFAFCTGFKAMYVPNTVTAIGSGAINIGGDGSTIYTPKDSLAYQIVTSEDTGSVSCTKCKVANSPEEMLQMLMPTPSPTPETTASPMPTPTASPTPEPTASPTPEPTASPTPEPTASPTPEPTASPTPTPTASPTPEPTASPTLMSIPSPTPTSKKANKDMTAPVFTLKKKVASSKQKYIQIKLKKFKGKYVEVFIKIDKRKYVKLKLANNKISKKKNILKFSYSFSKHTLYFKVRTYKKNGKKKIYSKKSKEKRIRV